MKTNQSSETRTVKGNLKRMLLTLAVVVAGFSAVNAQLPGKEENLAMNPNDETQTGLIKMSRFTARTVEGVVYLNWYMKGETDKSVFLVERSVNGGAFTSIGFKDGYPSPDGNTELLYSFSDKTPLAGITYYRIKQFKPDGILYGQETSVIIEEPLPLVESVE